MLPHASSATNTPEGATVAVEKNLTTGGSTRSQLAKYFYTGENNNTTQKLDYVDPHY